MEKKPRRPNSGSTTSSSHQHAHPATTLSPLSNRYQRKHENKLAYKAAKWSAKRKEFLGKRRLEGRATKKALCEKRKPLE
jgi:hypothetical protein